MTLRQAVTAGRAQLAEVQELAATADRDATLLLLDTLDLPRTTIYAYPGRLMKAREQALYARAIERRRRFEPVQYITGKTEFFGLELAVGPAVLIPRPETEGLVEAVLGRVPSDVPVRIADVGTGSGAIAIALALRLPKARIVGVDVSPAALWVAQENAERHGAADRVRFLFGDLLSGTNQEQERFEAVVSNPPYVPTMERESLHPQVSAWEPERALFAGEDGLAIYRRLIPQTAERLVAGGLLAMEIGHGQERAIRELLRGWCGVQVLPDLQGIARVVVARRR